MISFENIDKFDKQYDFYMNFLCILHNHIYYRHFYILDKENIPPKGQPTIVIANHQNGLMDAMAILHTMFKDRRQPVFIARGDIFKKDKVARILRFLKILPTFRTRDGSYSDVRSNLAIYNRAARVLRNGGTLVIFPEATHQHGHYMNTFKKGFCRIAFAAEELNDFKLGLQILPLNIHYSNYFSFHSDLMVTVGKPFTIEDFFDTYKENHDRGYHALNEKARARVKELTPDIDIPEYYNEIEALTQMMSGPLLRSKGLRPNYLPHQKDAAMTIIARIKLLQSDHNDTFTQLMMQTREYLALLKQLGLQNWIVNRKLSFFRLLWRILLMVVSLPLFVFGYVNNLIPECITRRLTNRIKDPMLHSSFQYVIGTIIAFPIFYLIIFGVVWAVSKHFLIAVAYLLAMFGTEFFSHYYKIALKKLCDYFKAQRHKHSAEYRRLCELNREITETMEKAVM